MEKVSVLFIAALLAMSSCAPRYNPNAQKPDSALSCSEIIVERERAKSAREAAQSNRGLSAQNIAWAIVFLPGIVANEYTNDQVQKAADARIIALDNLYARNGCK